MTLKMDMATFLPGCSFKVALYSLEPLSFGVIQSGSITPLNDKSSKLLKM